MESFIAPVRSHWYDKTWLVVILCLFFFPVGLYGLWKSRAIGQSGKLLGTAAVAALVAFSWGRPATSPGKGRAAAETGTARPTEPTDAEKAATALAAIRAQEEQTISAPALLSEYKANEVRADANFKGKTFYVEGEVESIGKTLTDAPYVVLKGDEYGILGVQCVFADRAEGASLNKGDVIAIKAECRGLMMNVQMDEATIEPTVASLKQALKSTTTKKKV